MPGPISTSTGWAKRPHIESTSASASWSPNFVEIDVREQTKGFANFELYVSFGIQKNF